MADSTNNASLPTPVRQGVATERSGSLSTERPSAAAQAAGLSTEDPSATPPNQSLTTSTGAVPPPDQSLTTSTAAVPQPDQSLPASTAAVPPPDQSLPTRSLVPYQVDLLNDRSLTRMHLWGPPGSGKTDVLVRKASAWLREGLDVDILSINSESRAISILMESQLQQVLRSVEGPEERKPKLRFHVIGSNLECWFRDCYCVHENTDAAVSCLANLAHDGKLHIIADQILSKVDSFSLRDFCSKLETNVEELSFWSASLEKLDQLPSGHKDKLLDSPLRTPLKVKDEVAKSSRLGNSRIPTYNSQTIPGATVGPEPIFMEHYKKRGHDKGTPQGCRRCGKDIADKLMKFTVDGDLQYRDVLIMFANPRGYLHGEKKNAFIRELEKKRIPVQVLPKDANYPQLRDVALATKNKVTVSHTRGVLGLERKIVVGMGGKMRSKREDDNRLLAMSRCTSQLIWIGEPSDS